MRNQYFLVPVALLFLAGCNSTQPPASTTAPVAQATSVAPVKLTATQKLEKYCRVCAVNGEPHEEYLPTRLNVKVDGKTYKFCSEPCRKKFDKAPKKYVLSG